MQLEAESIARDPASGAYVLEGGVVLRRGAVTLRARAARFDRASGEVIATGDVLLTDVARVVAADGVRAVLGGAFEAEGVVAFLKDGAVDVSGASTLDEARAAGRNRLSLSGSSVSGDGSGRLRLEGARLTLCDCGGHAPSWEIRAREADVIPGKRAILSRPVLRITPRFLFVDHPVPVLALPWLYLPLADRQTGLLLPRDRVERRHGLRLPAAALRHAGAERRPDPDGRIRPRQRRVERRREGPFGAARASLGPRGRDGGTRRADVAPRPRRRGGRRRRKPVRDRAPPRAAVLRPHLAPGRRRALRRSLPPARLHRGRPRPHDAVPPVGRPRRAPPRPPRPRARRGVPAAARRPGRGRLRQVRGGGGRAAPPALALRDVPPDRGRPAAGRGPRGDGAVRARVAAHRQPGVRRAAEIRRCAGPRPARTCVPRSACRWSRAPSRSSPSCAGPRSATRSRNPTSVSGAPGPSAERVSPRSSAARSERSATASRRAWSGSSGRPRPEPSRSMARTTRSTARGRARSGHLSTRSIPRGPKWPRSAPR